MKEKIKKYFNKVVDIQIKYTNFGFESNFTNCIFTSISSKNNAKYAVFLTSNGNLKKLFFENKDIKYDIRIRWLC